MVWIVVNENVNSFIKFIKINRFEYMDGNLLLNLVSIVWSINGNNCKIYKLCAAVRANIPERLCSGKLTVICSLSAWKLKKECTKFGEI